MNEADEEHHVAKLLVAELDRMDGSESHFDAKFLVLTENVRHHIKEEEDEMLPKARKVKVDFEAWPEDASPQGATAGRRRTPGRRGADGEGVSREGRLARGPRGGSRPGCGPRSRASHRRTVAGTPPRGPRAGTWPRSPPKRAPAADSGFDDVARFHFR